MYCTVLLLCFCIVLIKIRVLSQPNWIFFRLYSLSFVLWVEFPCWWNELFFKNYLSLYIIFTSVTLFLHLNFFVFVIILYLLYFVCYFNLFGFVLCWSRLGCCHSQTELIWFWLIDFSFFICSFFCFFLLLFCFCYVIYQFANICYLFLIS